MDNQGPRQYGAGDPFARFPAIDEAYVAAVAARQRAFDQRQAEFGATAELTRSAEADLARRWYGDTSPELENFREGRPPALQAELAEMKRTVERALPPDPSSRWGRVAAQFEPEAVARLTQQLDRRQASFRLYADMNKAAPGTVSEHLSNVQERELGRRPGVQPAARGRQYG